MVTWLFWGVGALALGYGGGVALSFLAPGPAMRMFRGASFAASGFQRKRVRVRTDAGQSEIAYCEAGQGETVLLLHGFGASMDTWLLYGRFLARHYHVVMCDVPGFGDSPFDPAQRYGYPEQCARLRAFVEALRLPKLHIAGNSMGGALAGLYAAAYPHGVRTLLLMNNAGVDMPRASDFQHRVDAGENPLIVESVADVDVLFEFCFQRPPLLPPFAKRIFASDATARVEANQRIFGEIYSDGPVLAPLLSQIKTPTLVMWGSQDRVLDASIVDVLEAELPNREVVTFEDCGHLPYMERPQAAARAHLRFMRQHGASDASERKLATDRQQRATA